MSIMIGVGLMAASMLLFAFAYGQTHRARPRAWTGNFYLMSTVCVTFTCAFPAGLGLAISTLVQAAILPGFALIWEIPVGVAVLLVSFLIARQMLASALPAPVPAHVVPLTPRPRPVAPTRKAA
jgi:hypothetical protein